MRLQPTLMGRRPECGERKDAQELPPPLRKRGPLQCVLHLRHSGIHVQQRPLMRSLRSGHSHIHVQQVRVVAFDIN
jgi:hypothetical protein